MGGGTSYQKTLKLLGLGDVNPAVFFNDFDVLHFVVESVEIKRHGESKGRRGGTFYSSNRNNLPPEF